MIIETDRLILRPITARDIVDVHKMNSHEDVAKFNTIGIPKSIDVTEQFLADLIKGEGAGKALAWIVRKKEDQIFIGEVGMNLKPDRYRSGEIYYSLSPDHWGQGYAFEAVESVVNHGFTTLDLHRIEAGVAVDNARSIKLLEKLGMTLEGRHRKILPIRGNFVDNFHYAVLDIDAGND